MTVIASTLLNLANRPSAGRVEAKLVGPGFVDGGQVLAGLPPVHVGDDGLWSIDFIPTADYKVAGTQYLVTQIAADGSQEERAITVPTTGGPYSLYDRLVDQPGDIEPAALASIRATVDEHLANHPGGPGGDHPDTATHVDTLGLVATADPRLTDERVPVDESVTEAKLHPDVAAQLAPSGTYVPLAGGTLTGPLTLAGDPTNALHAATRQYVLARIDALLGSGAPASLDTIVEIAAALQDNPDIVQDILDAIALRFTQAQGDARYRLLSTALTIADVTGLQAALDGKVDDAELGEFVRVVESDTEADALPAGSWALVVGEVVADTTAPSVPTGLSGQGGDTTVLLSWNAATDDVGVVGYRVYRDGVEVADQAGLSFLDTGRTNGVEYDYTVSAYDAADNESAQSSPVSVTPTADADVTPPAVPTGLSLIAGDGSIAADWDSNTEPDLHSTQPYQYRRGTTDPPAGSPVGVGVSAATIGGLTNATEYFVQVRAQDSDGNLSDWSASASATPAGSSSPSVAAAQATNTGSSQVDTIDLAVPAGTSGGDRLYMVLGVAANGTTIPDPDGWTLLAERQAVTPDLRVKVWTRLHDGTSSAYTVTLGTVRKMTGAILRLTGANATDPNDTTPVMADDNTVDVNFNAPSITTLGANRLVLYVVAASTGTSGTLSHGTLTEHVDSQGSGSGSIRLGVFSEVLATAGASGAKVITASAAARNTAITLAVKP